MNTLRALIDAIGGPETVGIAAAAAVAYLARQVLTRRPGSQARTNSAFGQRLQNVEQDLRLETVRRIQIERELGHQGIRLPYWPTDADVDVPISVAEKTRALDETGEVRRVPVPPLPMSESVARFARHSERTTP